MLIANLEPPWSVGLTGGEHQLVVYVLVVAVLAFTAGIIRSWVTRNEVGSRYRTAVTARIGMLAVALLTYLLLTATFFAAYDPVGAGWMPNGSAIDVFAARYMGWTVSVPLLTMELLAVCGIAGSVSRRSRAIALVSSGAMIFCGFLGAIVIDDGTGILPFVLWALAGVAFGAVAVAVLLRAVRESRAVLTPEAQTLLARATLVLLTGWVVYPIVYFLPLFGASGVLTTVIMIVLTATDVTVKLGFANRIHRVAKLRTAEDVRAGVDVHPESIWISSVKQSDAGLPREINLATGAAIHERRPRPPISTATASAEPDSTDF